MDGTVTYWRFTIISSSKGLVQTGDKLPELMLTQISVAIWRHQAPKKLKFWGNSLEWFDRMCK